VALAALSLFLLGILVSVSAAVIWSALLSAFLVYLVFCALNYRVLRITSTDEVLTLQFGLITWRIALSNVAGCTLDDTSLWRIGGAGLHFSPIHGRYRAMFNFLEYPRLLLTLHSKKGPVREVAFSTRHPEHLQSLIRQRMRGVA
jgi:hypothetical protein